MSRPVLILLCLGAAFGILGTNAWAQRECTSFPYHAPEHSQSESPLDVRHARIEVQIHPDERLLAGQVVYEMALERPLEFISILASSADVDSIFASAVGAPAHPLSFRRTKGDSLLVPLSPLAESGIEVDSVLKLAITFRNRGLRFEENAVSTLDGFVPWFPWTGRLGDRFTSELLLTVPAGWIAVGPGIQTAERTADDGSKSYLFSAPHELPARVLDFAAGIFQPDIAFAEVSGGRRVPVVGLDGHSTPKTPIILTSLSEWIGLAYPFERYAQFLRAQDSSAAGAGISAVPSRVAVDERGRLDYDPSFDLARLLARQWIGTVVSASDWSHAWLEEGLTSYLGVLIGGDAHLRDLRADYLNETNRYVRPLVWRRWNHPAELFDAHSRSKGAWIAHMMERRAGEDAFREAFALFVKWNQFRPADSQALLRAFEAVTETDWAAFADEWIFSAGHPILEVSYAPAEEGLRVRVQQTQQGDDVPEVFHLGLTVEAGGLGTSERFHVEIDERSEEFILPFSSRPRFLAVDPDDDWLLTTSTEQPASAWVAQLRYASTSHARLRAAKTLAQAEQDAALLIGLRSAFESEEDADVRAGIVEAIANLETAAAERAVVSAFQDPSSIVRKAILSALPQHQDRARAVQFTREAAQGDPSYYVQADAVRALAELGAPDAVDVARSALITPSHDGVIRAAGLDALTRLHHRAPGEALSAALTYSGSGNSTRVRTSAVRLLGALAEGNRDAQSRLVALLSAQSRRVRATAAEELVRLGDFDQLADHREAESSAEFRAFITSLLACR